MNSQGEARDSNRDQKPFVSLKVQACSEESPSVFPSCANALTLHGCSLVSDCIPHIKPSFNSSVVISAPYGRDSHCHSLEKLPGFFSLAILHVGACVCVLLVMAARDCRYSLLITRLGAVAAKKAARLYTPVRTGLFFTGGVVAIIMCVCPNRRNASSWAEPIDGGGASVDHPGQLHRPQHGGWKHGEQHPGLRQRTGSVESTEPVCNNDVPA